MKRSRASYARAAKRSWVTRRANARKRSNAAKRKERSNERELEGIERLLGEDFENLTEARQALAEEQQDEPITITSISEWNALDFDGAEWEEIAANADY